MEAVVIYRPAQESDTPRLLELTAATGAFKPYEVEVLAEVLADYHARSPDSQHATLIAECDGSIVGYAYYAPDIMTDGTWYLYWIAIDHTLHGRGLGSALLKQVEQAIRASEGRLLLIETSSQPSYHRTRMFYLKHGYQIAGVLRDFYHDGDSMVIFRKRLTGTDQDNYTPETLR